MTAGKARGFGRNILGRQHCAGLRKGRGQPQAPYLHPVASASGCMVALQLKVEPLRPCTSSTVGRAGAACRPLARALPPALSLLLPQGWAAL